MGAALAKPMDIIVSKNAIASTVLIIPISFKWFLAFAFISADCSALHCPWDTLASDAPSIRTPSYRFIRVPVRLSSRYHQQTTYAPRGGRGTPFGSFTHLRSVSGQTVILCLPFAFYSAFPRGTRYLG
mgnify:CR=1